MMVSDCSSAGVLPSTPEIILRKDAIALGLKKYFTGRPCKHGHITVRDVASRGCMTCTMVRARIWKSKSPTYRAVRAAGMRESSRKNPQKNRDLWIRLRMKQLSDANARPKPSVCECCGRAPGVRGLHFDHDHETGLFRGWICFRCNTAIGKLGDTLEGARRAVAYLERAYGHTLASAQEEILAA
jgi:hypothetical protein